MRTPEQIKEYQKKYREKNKQKRADYAQVYHASWYEKNKITKQAQNKEWDNKNPIKRKEIRVRHRDKFPENGAKASKRYRERYPELAKAASSRYSKTEKWYYSTYKAGAIRRGYSFELTREDFLSVLMGDCRYCAKKEAMGIDRLDNSLGYLISNCVPCCTHCNRMKWAHNEDFFLSHITKIYQNKML